MRTCAAGSLPLLIAAVVAQRAAGGGTLIVIGDDHAPLARADVFPLRKAEASRIAQCPRLPARELAPDALRAILDDLQAVAPRGLQDRLHGADDPVEMNDDQRPGARGDQRLDGARVDGLVIGDVAEDGHARRRAGRRGRWTGRYGRGRSPRRRARPRRRAAPCAGPPCRWSRRRRCARRPTTPIGFRTPCRAPPTRRRRRPDFSGARMSVNVRSANWGHGGNCSRVVLCPP